MPGPLAGVRVVDVTSMVSGPVTTMLLADQGAEVIKIEPIDGEYMRQLRPSKFGIPAVFFSCNRNKKSLALDLKKKAGMAVLRRLLATADVFIENFRPGTIERMGFAEESVRETRPDIIFVSMNGLGERGPQAHQRVYDPIVQALSGLADIQTDRETGLPRMVRTVIADNTAALTAAQAITAALFSRERTGEGQHIRLSMLDAMVAFLWPEGMGGLTFVDDETDPSEAQMGMDRVYTARDGYITVAGVSDAEWAGLCRALGRPELIDDDRFKTAAARSKHVAERRAITAQEIGNWHVADILPRLDAEDVPNAPILKRTEIPSHPQISANGTIEVHEFPGFGKLRQARPAARFDKTPAEIHSPAPRLGQHTGETLADLEYSDEEIATLVDRGVVAQLR